VPEPGQPQGTMTTPRTLRGSPTWTPSPSHVDTSVALPRIPDSRSASEAVPRGRQHIPRGHQRHARPASRTAAPPRRLSLVDDNISHVDTSAALSRIPDSRSASGAVPRGRLDVTRRRQPPRPPPASRTAAPLRGLFLVDDNIFPRGHQRHARPASRTAAPPWAVPRGRQRRAPLAPRTAAPLRGQSHVGASATLASRHDGHAGSGLAPRHPRTCRLIRRNHSHN
jgi:hypothetical protein